MAAAGSVPSCTAEMLGEAAWIAEASVALVGWPLPGAGAASGPQPGGRDRSLTFLLHLGRNSRLPQTIARRPALRSLSVLAALLLRARWRSAP